MASGVGHDNWVGRSHHTWSRRTWKAHFESSTSFVVSKHICSADKVPYEYRLVGQISNGTDKKEFWAFQEGIRARECRAETLNPMKFGDGAALRTFEVFIPPVLKEGVLTFKIVKQNVLTKELVWSNSKDCHLSVQSTYPVDTPTSSLFSEVMGKVDLIIAHEAMVQHMTDAYLDLAQQGFKAYFQTIQDADWVLRSQVEFLRGNPHYLSSARMWLFPTLRKIIDHAENDPNYFETVQLFTHPREEGDPFERVPFLLFFNLVKDLNLDQDERVSALLQALSKYDLEMMKTADKWTISILRHLLDVVEKNPAMDLAAARLFASVFCPEILTPPSR